jgi:hypothetical protein
MHGQRCEGAESSGHTPPPIEDTLFAVELLGLVTWAEPLMGDAWRRAVGLKSDRVTADRFMDWFVALVEDHLRTEFNRHG